MASEFKDDWLRKSRLSIDQVGFKRYPQTDLKDLRSVTQSRGKSFFFISAKYESLDYDITEKQIYLEDEKTKPYSYFVKRDILRPLIFMGAGIIIACIGTFVHVAIQRIGEIKYSYLCNFIDDHHSTGAGDLTLTILMWYLGVIVLVMLSSSIVIFIAPYASGGGVAQTIAYLNGISVPNLLSIKGLFVKMFSTVLTCTSGLAGGKEGPMLHMGATVGSRFPDLFTKFKYCSIFQDFQNDHERRDLGAAGFAAGIACAFHAPIGGLLLALEEGVSYWNISLMWKIFLCSITSVFFITVLLSIIEGAPGHFNSPDLLTLGKIEDETTHYEYFEFIYFIIVGVIGGILGAILVFIHMYLTYFRKRFINTNIRKLTESFLVAFLVASLYMISIFSYNKCKTVASKTEGGGHAANKTVGQVYCPDKEYNVMTLLIYQTSESLITILFSPVIGDVEIGSLIILFVIYFININFTMGLTLSAGLFVPQIVFGAIWGRIFGIFLRYVHHGAKWAVPSKYALLGAASQLSGSIRKTFSVMVIMTEASGNLSFAIPFMVVVALVKIVGDFFTMSLYDLQAHMMGFPLLSSDPPPLDKDYKAKHVMSIPPLSMLSIQSQISDIINLLSKTTHNGFPIVQNNKLRGLILRHDLLVILKYKLYKYLSPTTTQEFVERNSVFKNEISKKLNLEDCEVNEKYYNFSIDLVPYMNLYPYTLSETSSLATVYKLFRCIGLRHIVILNNSNEPVGVITRKDLARYHVWQHCCMMGVKELKVL